MGIKKRRESVIVEGVRGIKEREGIREEGVRWNDVCKCSRCV
jgi:hypothetical protein